MKISLLDDLRHDSQTIVDETVEVACDARPFSWDVDSQDMARALSSAAALPWVIWSTIISLAYSMPQMPINLFARPATSDR